MHIYPRTLAHDVSPENMLRWFVYMIEDVPCQKTIVGSTTKPTATRWSSHKSSCNNGPSTSTGLSKHFTMNGGCPNDAGREKETLQHTLIDFIDVSGLDTLRDLSAGAGNVPG